MNSINESLIKNLDDQVKYFLNKIILVASDMLFKSKKNILCVHIFYY